MKKFLLVGLLGAASCGSSGPEFAGTYSGNAQLTSGSRTVKKAGTTTVTGMGADFVVNVQLPLPTADATPPSTACAIPATVDASGKLAFSAYDCPAVTVSGDCVMTLQIASGKGLLVATSLTLTGSGTVVVAKCGAGGTDVTDSFTFEAPLTK